MPILALSLETTWLTVEQIRAALERVVGKESKLVKLYLGDVDLHVIENIDSDLVEKKIGSFYEFEELNTTNDDGIDESEDDGSVESEEDDRSESLEVGSVESEEDVGAS